jgi:hypothetical protein
MKIVILARSGTGMAAGRCGGDGGWPLPLAGFADCGSGARRAGSGMQSDGAAKPIRINFHRPNDLLRGLIIDWNLDDHRLDELRRWAEREMNFVVIDSDAGEDITRMMLA